jgi:hypothetical protein
VPFLTDLFDAPTPVAVRPSAMPGGRIDVRPVRVIDLAEMASFASGLAGDPMDGLADAEAIEDTSGRQRAMRGVLERCKRHPVCPWTDEWATAFGSESGAVALLWFVLRRSFPAGWSLGDAAELVARLSGPEIEAIHTAAWRVDPVRSLLGKVLGGRPPGSDDEGDWHDEEERRGALGARVAFLLGLGMPLESIAAMPLKAFLAAGSKDDAGDRLVLPTVEGQSPGKVMARFRAIFGRGED